MGIHNEIYKQCVDFFYFFIFHACACVYMMLIFAIHVIVIIWHKKLTNHKCFKIFIWMNFVHESRPSKAMIMFTTMTLKLSDEEKNSFRFGSKIKYVTLMWSQFGSQLLTRWENSMSNSIEKLLVKLEMLTIIRRKFVHYNFYCNLFIAIHGEKTYKYSILLGQSQPKSSVW